MSSRTVLLKRVCNGRVAQLTLNRPAKLNALSAALGDELRAHVSALAADSTLRAVVLHWRRQSVFGWRRCSIPARTPSGA